MPCIWIVHMTCSRVVQDLSMTYLWLVHILFMSCSLPFHDLFDFGTTLWLIYDLLTFIYRTWSWKPSFFRTWSCSNWSPLVDNLCLTCSHYLLMDCSQLVHYFFCLLSCLVHDLFKKFPWLVPDLITPFSWPNQSTARNNFQSLTWAWEYNENKLVLSSAKLSRTKFGWCEVDFEFVLKQFTVKNFLC